MGENNTWSTWNTSITSLTAMDSATTVSSGDDSYDVLTTDASTISYAAPGSASGTNGTALFGNRVSVIWGDSSNVLTVFDVNFNDDDHIRGNDNSQYSTNIANWLFYPDETAPTISSTTVAADNSTIDVTFSEAVYNTTGGSGALEESDFKLSISGGTKL